MSRLQLRDPSRDDRQVPFEGADNKFERPANLLGLFGRADIADRSRRCGDFPSGVFQGLQPMQPAVAALEGGEDDLFGELLDLLLQGVAQAEQQEHGP